MVKRTESQQEKRSSLIPAPVAGLLSLVVPGLGQILARYFYRGLLLLASMGTIVGLLAWRIHLLAHREGSLLAVLAKALQRRPSFVIPMLIGAVALPSSDYWPGASIFWHTGKGARSRCWPRPCSDAPPS